MPPADDWSFDSSKVKLDGDMTLVLVRRSGTKLKGWHVEFADDATAELREMVTRTTAAVEARTRRGYEASIRITAEEYLAVPDELVKRAAPPLPAKSEPEPEGEGATGGKTAPKTVEDAPAVQHIETDPQVRALLRNASGLPLLPAQQLTKQPFAFYAVVVGSDPNSRVAFVRKTNPIKTLTAGRLWFSYGERLKKVTEPLMGLDDHFDLIVTADGIAVLNQTAFDLLFRDAATLVERYPIWAKAFTTIGLDDDQTDALVEMCRRDSRLATRLRQIHESGHLAAGHVSLEQVLAEADVVAGGRERFLKNDKLDFACQDAGTLMKLLNDDLFVGGLSKVPYEAGSKARYTASGK